MCRKKRTNYFLSLVLTLALLFSVSPQAFAVDPPTIVIAEVTSQGDISLYFDKSMSHSLANGTSLGVSGFTVMVNGLADLVTDVQVTNTANKIKLVLTTDILAGDTVTIEYLQPGDPSQQVTATDGGVLASFAAMTAEPATVGYVSSNTSTDGTKVEVTFNKTMADPAGKEAQFTVNVNGSADPITAAALKPGDSKTINLTLTNPVLPTDTVTVAYTKGSVTTYGGSSLATFAAETVSACPVLQSAVTNAAGDTITLTFNKTMDPLPAAPAGFSVTAGGVANTVTGATLDVDTTKINLTLTTPVTHGQTILLSYSDSGVKAVDTGVLANFSGAQAYTVTNNVLAGPVVVLAEVTSQGDISVYCDKSMSHGLANGTSLGVSGFTVMVDETADVVTDVQATNTANKIKLVLTNKITAGTGVTNATIEYLQPGDPVQQVTATDGGVMASFAAKTVEPATVSYLSFNTSTDGTKVTVTFNKTMADPTGKEAQFTVNVNGSANPVTAAALKAGDSKAIILTLTNAVAPTDTVTVAYTKGSVTTYGGTSLATFTTQTVTNNVPSGSGQPQTLATVTTGEPSGTGAQKAAATFYGSVVSASPVTECGIIYSANPIPVVSSIAQVTATKVSLATPGTGNFTCTVNLSALSDGKYYTRAYAVNSAGLAMGDPVDFPVGTSLFLMDATLNNGVTLVNNNAVASGSYTVDIEISKNISSDSVLANNQTCFSLKDNTLNTSIPITVYRVGTGTEEDYKDHLYFDVTLVSGHSYQITISGSLKANNLNTLQNPITINFTSSDSVAGSTDSATGPKTSEAPLVTAQVSVSTGGTVQATDGTKVIVPAGAIPAGTNGTLDIAIYTDTESVDPTNPGIASYDQQYTERSFGPSGTQFAAPVTLVIPFGLANIPASDYPYLSVYLWQNGRWVKVGGVVDPATKTVSITVNHFSTYRIMADKTSGALRIGGSDRYDTAVKIAASNFATGADNVVLARGDISADSLTAVPLAKYLSAPLLLTPQSTLPDQVLNEIKTLKAKRVYIIGGEQVISAKVAQTISAQGITVQRIAGSNRYATAYQVAKYMGSVGQAVIVNGNNNAYADALSISSWAAYNTVPILYADGTSTLPAATTQALIDLKVTRTILVGGTGVLPTALEKLVPNPERYAGSDRYGTNYAVLSKLQAKATKVYAVTGANFADALAGAAVAGQYNAWILLTGNSPTSQNGLTPEQTQLLKDSKGTVLDLHIFGGTTAVPNNVATELKTNLGL